MHKKKRVRHEEKKQEMITMTLFMIVFAVVAVVFSTTLSPQYALQEEQRTANCQYPDITIDSVRYDPANQEVRLVASSLLPNHDVSIEAGLKSGGTVALEDVQLQRDPQLYVIPSKSYYHGSLSEFSNVIYAISKECNTVESDRIV